MRNTVCRTVFPIHLWRCQYNMYCGVARGKFSSNKKQYIAQPSISVTYPLWKRSTLWNLCSSTENSTVPCTSDMIWSHSSPVEREKTSNQKDISDKYRKGTGGKAELTLFPLTVLKMWLIAKCELDSHLYCAAEINPIPQRKYGAVNKLVGSTVSYCLVILLTDWTFRAYHYWRNKNFGDNR